MELILERCSDSEVAAAAANAPEQVGVLLRAGPQQLPVGCRHVGRYQVVAGKSIAAVQPAQPSAEREARDPGHRHHAKRRRQSDRLRGAVELTQREPRVRPDGPRLWIDLDGFHPRQVKHDGIVTHRVACNAVTAPAHRERQVVSTYELDATDYIGRIRGPDHGQWASINHAVEHRARRVVTAVTGVDHITSQTGLELAAYKTRDPVNV